MGRWHQEFRDRHGRRHVAEAESVPALRGLRARLFADPDVQWVSPTPECVGNAEVAQVQRCPACGARADTSTGRARRVEVCRCGIVHVVLRCNACWKQTWTPARHDGCGEIAWDHEAVHDAIYRKHASRRWRPVR